VETGFAEYLVKPVEPERLQEVLAAVGRIRHGG
jgi:hypothetical protein